MRSPDDLYRTEATMIVGVLRESFPHERRVALIPALVPTLIKARAEVLVESGAGADAGFPDAEYEAKGARMAPRTDVFSRADVILMVRTPGANPTAGARDTTALGDGQILIDRKVLAAVEALATTQEAGQLTLKGLHRPVATFNVTGVGS